MNYVVAKKIQLFISLIFFVSSLLAIILLNGKFLTIYSFIDPNSIKMFLFSFLLLIFNRKEYWPSNFLIVGILSSLYFISSLSGSNYPDTSMLKMGQSIACLPLLYGSFISTLGSFYIFMKN